MPQTPESARKSGLGGQIKEPLETIPTTRREARRLEATAQQKLIIKTTNPGYLMIDIRLVTELCPFQKFVCLSSCPIISKQDFLKVKSLRQALFIKTQIIYHYTFSSMSCFCVWCITAYSLTVRVKFSTKYGKMACVSGWRDAIWRDAIGKGGNTGTGTVGNNRG